MSDERNTEPVEFPDEGSPIGNIESTPDPRSGNVVIQGKGSIFSSSFYFKDFYDDALSKKFIKATERMIRQSFDYKTYMDLLAAAVPEIAADDIEGSITTADAEIQIHHYPLDLYSVVETVMAHHILAKDDFTSESLSDEIMRLHFAHKIGLVPLAVTNHELAHLNAIFISDRQIFGDWRWLVANYGDGLSPDNREFLRQYDEFNKSGQATDFRGIYR